MLDFTEINIDDKELFDRYLKPYNPQASELTFTNFFMWRNFYKFRYAVKNGYLCIISARTDTAPFAFTPIGNAGEEFAAVVSELKSYFSGKGWRLQFKRVTEDEVKLFETYVRDEKEVVYDRDSSDYVYLAEDLTRLAGKRFDGKRNHINKFKKSYTYEYVQLSENLLDECYRIMEEWCAQRSCDEHKEFYCEKLANTELLMNYKTLECKGALIQVNERFEGFTVGERLNSDTAVIHIEKANGSINGLYTFINQQFCENEWQDLTCINREQDLGIEGLRKAKLSYNPVKMIHKYTVKIQ